MKQYVVFLLLVTCQTLRAEYKWTGTEWQWVETPQDKTTSVDEGSGDDDYDDENYSYDYKDDKDVGASNVGVNLPTDDEDFGPDGSGDDNLDLLYDDQIEGSGDYVVPTKRVTTTTASPTIDLYSPFGGRPQSPSINLDNRGGQDSFFEPFTPKRTSTESPVIDLDNRGPTLDFGSKPVDFGPKDPIDDYDPSLYDDDYPDNYDDTDLYDSPPYDDIPIDEVFSTTTTTSTTPKPIHRDTPIIQDIPSNRPVSFFAQPGILAAVIGGAVVGLLCAILLVMFIVYRMRKKDEGSYILDEPTRTHNGNLYSKTPNKEFYA